MFTYLMCARSNSVFVFACPALCSRTREYGVTRTLATHAGYLSQFLTALTRSMFTSVRKVFRAGVLT
jgi:hypothetical protein